MLGEGITRMERLMPLAVKYGAQAAYAIFIALIGYLIAQLAERWLRASLLRSPRMDVTFAGFAASLLKYLILTFVLMAVLGLFGIETTSFIAVLGAASLAIGLALQGTLSSLAAGVMLMIFRPFRVGDQVEVAGKSGTVRHIDLFTTELATPDNVRVTLPNKDTWGAAVVNYSAYPERRVELTFAIPLGANIEEAITAIRRVIEADKRVLQTPEAPFAAATEVGGGNVKLTARVWCKAADYWDLRYHLLREIKQSLEQSGIAIS